MQISPCLNFMQLNGQQSKIDMVLTAKKIEFEKRDIASSEENKKKMRDLIGDQKAIAPQLFNDDQYCGVSWSKKGVCCNVQG